MIFTLKELLEKYKVIIPQLQRDYAQGREGEAELRKGFVSAIKHALYDDSKHLNLDFVYGYTEAINADENAFIPLDGQQRLTTLWLLMWHLSPRVNNVIPYNIQKVLLNFTYDTRISSKRFCANLITQPFSLNTEDLVSVQLRDTFWFMASWSNDPTIISMLNMLDTLQIEILDKEKAWENFTNQRKITFDYLDIKSEEFKLTDELYIKMNSRGKPLTQFENFKAQFSSLLDSDTTDYHSLTLDFEGAKISYKQYFAFKIDSTWMDLFWGYRNITNVNTDDCIYNFINYVAEFLFYKDNPKTLSSEVAIDFEFLNRIFSLKRNIGFLFDSLDWLSKQKNLPLFFDHLFLELSMFDDGPDDYFLRAITNMNFDVKDKVVLYTILSYCNNPLIPNRIEDLKDIVRIVRNLLSSVRQVNQSQRIEFVTNLRLPNVSEYCKFIDTFLEKKSKDTSKSFYQILAENEFVGFPKDSIQNEKSKAQIFVSKPKLINSIQRLEEHKHIQGNTIIFKLESDEIDGRIDAFYEIWSDEVENNLIIRALLTINDFSVQTHSYSALGDIWYFGTPDYWNRILTASYSDVAASFSDTMDSLLALYLTTSGKSPSTRLRKIIAGYKPQSLDWRYYFIKYEGITEISNLRLNIFTWGDEAGFEINALGNSGTHPLHSYHLNPYLNELKNHFISNKKVRIYAGRFSDLSYLRVSPGVEIFNSNKGWLIKPVRKYQIAQNLVRKYSLTQHDNNLLLKETGKKDRIEIAVDFINDLLSL